MKIIIKQHISNSRNVSLFHSEGRGNLQPIDCKIIELSRYVKCNESIKANMNKPSILMLNKRLMIIIVENKRINSI